jgi:hypothetical protein
MAGFLLVQHLHFDRPWWSDAGVEPPWMADICSSAIAPALPYYRPSMDISAIAPALPY